MRELFFTLFHWLQSLATNKIVLLSIGGAVGTNARYWLTLWFDQKSFMGNFPLGTVVVNVSGSLILAVVAVLFVEWFPPEYFRGYVLLGSGFCGGFTTFSTFEYETYRLVQDGSWKLALVNVVVSVTAGFLAVLVIMTLAHRVR